MFLNFLLLCEEFMSLRLVFHKIKWKNYKYFKTGVFASFFASLLMVFIHPSLFFCQSVADFQTLFVCQSFTGFQNLVFVTC